MTTVSVSPEVPEVEDDIFNTKIELLIFLASWSSLILEFDDYISLFENKRLECSW